ncbi:GAF domain-containing protein [Phormidesmis sp. 146-33]
MISSSLTLPDASLPPEDFLSALMPAVGEFLQVDRCFFYLRNPQTQMGRVPFCWTRDSSVPTVYDEDWKPEPDSLPDEDPMFAAALKIEPSIFVEDVEATSPEILNAQFEKENFGHRALIHGHVCQHGQLWGVLQPCVFGCSRIWTQDEQSLVNQLIQEITPTAVAYIKTYSP